MKTLLVRRFTWTIVIIIGILILCPKLGLPTFYHELILFGFGGFAIATGLFGLFDSFQKAGLEAASDSPGPAIVVDIMADTALILYGAFLVLPWGREALAQDTTFRLITGLLAIGIGGCGWLFDWRSGRRSEELLLGSLVASIGLCGAA